MIFMHFFVLMNLGIDFLMLKKGVTRPAKVYIEACLYFGTVRLTRPQCTKSIAVDEAFEDIRFTYFSWIYNYCT